MTAPHTPLTRAVLDLQQCGRPGCDHTAHDGLVLCPGCHPRAAVVVSYSDGVLVVRCARCSQFVTAIAVAAGVIEH